MKKERTKVNYRKIAEDYYGISASGMHVHHLDGNSHNNSCENLVICTKEEHADFHRKMGQEQIALLLEGQTSDNWFSIIGKIGAKKSKGVPRIGYTVSESALLQRSNARRKKGNPKNTKLSLRSDNRTVEQKIGKQKAVKTKQSRNLTELEEKQFNDFRRKGTEAAKLATIGSKKLIHPLTGSIKFAKPNTDKWVQLTENGYISKL